MFGWERLKTERSFFCIVQMCSCLHKPPKMLVCVCASQRCFDIPSKETRTGRDTLHLSIRRPRGQDTSTPSDGHQNTRPHYFQCAKTHRRWPDTPDHIAPWHFTPLFHCQRDRQFFFFFFFARREQRFCQASQLWIHPLLSKWHPNIQVININ